MNLSSSQMANICLVILIGKDIIHYMVQRNIYENGRLTKINKGGNMLVVLEGCDGSGKSTLARFLSKIMNAEIVHCTASTPNNYDYFLNIIEASKTRNIIADRFCYGQFVYQEAEDRRLNMYQLYKLEAQMLTAGTKVVYVAISPEYAESRLRSRGDYEQTLDQLRKYVKGFENIFKQSSLNIYRYNTLTGGIEL